MINSENLCMGCMREIGDEPMCPHCKYVKGTDQVAPYLPVHTVIGGRYVIGKLLEYNGDGATYIAWDSSEEKAVKIREFLPDTLCGRRPGEKQVTVMSGCELTFSDCMADFLELWHKLARMSGLSALENVLDVFEENLTAYAVLEHIESISLRTYLLRNSEGYISWEKARGLFMPVLSTLGMLHTAGIIHRGISPVTLRIGRDRKMRISGFSVWQARTARSDLTVQLFPGYAAVEQYGFEGKQGPWTDIYSFAATLYRALIGTDPIEATERLTNDRLMVPGKFAEQLPAYVINGLINALQILPEDRTRSVEQLRAELSASPAATASDFVNSSTEIPRAPVKSSAEKKQPAKKPAQNKKAVRKPSGKNSQKDENKMIVIRTALISAIVCLVIFLIVVLAAGDKLGLSPAEPETEITTSSEMVDVPNFVNRNYSEVMATPYWTSNFNFTKVEEYSDTVTKGIIIKQSVQSESKVNKGTTIVLTVSKGVEQFALPNVIGMDYEEAKEKLQESKFKVKREYIENDGTHTAEEVQSVLDMTIGMTYSKGTTVTLLVWDEAPTTEESSVYDPFAQQPTTTVPSNPGNQTTTTVVPSVPSEQPTEPVTNPLIPQTTVPVTEPPTQAPTTTSSIMDLLF